MVNRPIHIVCSRCESEDILIDAKVKWHLQGRYFSVESVCNTGYCEKCQEDVTIIIQGESE